MNDPNKPIIDTRTMVTGERPAQASGGAPVTSATPAVTPGGSVSSTPSVSTSATSSVPTTQTATQTQISSTIPDQFKGGGNEELIDYLERKIQEHRPLSKEQLEKMRRRQRAQGIMSGISDAVQSVANLVFTNQYAPNMYNAAEGMSARARARFERDKAERAANDEKFFNYAMMLGKLKDAEKERGLQAWQIEQNLARHDKERTEDLEYRDKEFETRKEQWQKTFDREEKWHQEEVERWERQFAFTSKMEQQRLGLEAQRLAHSLKQGEMSFNLGSGNGNVTLSLSQLNASNISRIFNTLPEDVRNNIHGDAIMGKNMLGMTTVVGYQPPSTEAMLIAIGAYVENSPATQNAIRQVAGLEVGDKPAGY